MLKRILGVVVALVMAGPAAAVQLQGADLLIVKGLGSNVLTRIDPATGQETVISGCVDLLGDDNCQEVQGEGPWPVWFKTAVVSPTGSIFATGYVGACSPAQAQVPGGCDRIGPEGSEIPPSGAYVLEIDPETGNRTAVIAGAPSEFAVAMVPSVYYTASMPGLTGVGLAILVGFMLGVSYMKGKHDGKVAA